MLDESKVYVCLQQYTQRLVQKLRMNKWPLELLNQIELLDVYAENRFRGSLTLECMWVCRNYLFCVCVCVCGCVLLRMYRRIVLHIHMCKPTQGHLHVIGELNIVWAMRDSNLCNCYSSHIAGGIKNDLGSRILPNRKALLHNCT